MNKEAGFIFKYINFPNTYPSLACGGGAGVGVFKHGKHPDFTQMLRTTPILTFSPFGRAVPVPRKAGEGTVLWEFYNKYAYLNFSGVAILRDSVHAIALASYRGFLPQEALHYGKKTPYLP